VLLLIHKLPLKVKAQRSRQNAQLIEMLCSELCFDALQFRFVLKLMLRDRVRNLSVLLLLHVVELSLDRVSPRDCMLKL